MRHDDACSVFGLGGSTAMLTWAVGALVRRTQYEALERAGGVIPLQVSGPAIPHNASIAPAADTGRPPVIRPKVLEAENRKRRLLAQQVQRVRHMLRLSPNATEQRVGTQPHGVAGEMLAVDVLLQASVSPAWQKLCDGPCYDRNGL